MSETDAVALLLDQFPDGHPAVDELIGIRSACRRLRADNARLRALLDAARICFKNRDQSEREAAVYTEICRALQGYVAVPRLAAAGPPYGGQR